MHRRRQTALWGTLALASMTSCLVDADRRCGPNQQLDDGICVCAVGHTLQAGSCVPVGTGMRPTPDGGIGVTCIPGTMPCSDPAFPLCQTAPSGASYCTSTGCSADVDCGAGFSCQKGVSPSYCRRHYEGQRQPCSSTADCARFDAKYCVVQLSSCSVRDCMPDACDPDWTCFDLSQILPGEPKICAPNELIPK